MPKANRLDRKMQTVEDMAGNYGVSLSEARRKRRVEMGEIDEEEGSPLPGFRGAEMQAILEVLRESAARRGIDYDTAVCKWRDEWTEFRISEKKPSHEWFRVYTARFGKSYEEAWNYIKRMRKSDREKSRRNSRARASKGLQVPPVMQRRALGEEGNGCGYCGERTDHPAIDHIFPSLGNTRANLVVSCKSCNSSKGDHDVQTWARTQGPRMVKKVDQLISERGLKGDSAKREAWEKNQKEKDSGYKKPRRAKQGSTGVQLSPEGRSGVERYLGNSCVYYGERIDDLILDLLVASRGMIEGNFVVECPSCNRAKGELDGQVWAGTQGPCMVEKVEQLILERKLEGVECPRCGLYFHSNEMDVYCNDCWDEIMAKD